MSSKAYETVSGKVTPQTEPMPGKAMIANDAGGYVFNVGAWAKFERFVALGSEGGHYYAKEQPLTADNAKNAQACIEEDGKRAVDLIVAISDAGRAPKNAPAEFALALAASAGSPTTRAYALDALPKVCRIPTHLFHFVTYVKQQRGMGRQLRRALANWYAQFPADKLAFELLKYQSRDGWSNRDVLRQAHAKGLPAATMRWAIGADLGARAVKRLKGTRIDTYPAAGELPTILAAFEQAKTADTATLVKLIQDHGLTREMVPSEALAKPEVWEALLGDATRGMPITALLRNLGNLSKCGLLTPMSAASKTVVERLHDQEGLRRGRVHPAAVLIALKTYGQGKGLKGAGEWTVVPSVMDAADDCFYLAYGALEPTGKRLLYALDISGSMSMQIAGLPISAAEAVACMAMQAVKLEQEFYVMGFAKTFKDLGLTPKMRLDDVMERTSNQNFGSTDCSLPAQWALKQRMALDGIVILTDNETWSGRMHPTQALKFYRDTMGLQVKQVVGATTPTNFSIADPSDPLSLDVIGFDTAVPSVVREFLVG